LFLSVVSYSQTVTQTYYDKCTGETKVYVIPLQGSTAVIYYNRSMIVTFNDIQSGAFQKWLEETYLWWTNFNPCSAAQATQNVIQQTTQQVTQQASSAVSSVPTISKPETSTTSESTTSSDSSSKSDSSSSKSQEKKEESKSEEKREEKKKQQVIQPILIAANYMTMQNLDGSFNQVVSVGLSKSSLTGATSYSANAMVWSNLKQFSVSLSKNSILFNYDKKVPVRAGNELLGYTYVRGTIYKITGVSITAMLIFNTRVLSAGINDVFLLKRGVVFGYALGATFINIDKDVIISPLLTAFITKPFSFKRYIISPMVAASSSPVNYTTSTNEATFSRYLTYIVGSNFDFNLTKRFKANLGITIINSTQDMPMTYAVTIGSKIKL